MLAGLTTPEKRMNSSPWLIATSFSPETSRLPLGSTSITVHGDGAGEGVVGGRLALAGELVVVAGLGVQSLEGLAGQALNSVGTLTSMSCERSAPVFDFFAAAVFSTMLMTRVSPTWRARRSSNSGRT
jgi:hypothetical protein